MKRRTEYLLALAQLVDEARQLADLPPDGDGWGGGFPLPNGFAYRNTSDLLFEVASAIRQGAEAEA